MLVWTTFSIWPHDGAPVLWNNKNYKHENVISSLIKICKSPYEDSGETHNPSFPIACAYIKHRTYLKTQLIYRSTRASLRHFTHIYKLRNSKVSEVYFFILNHFYNYFIYFFLFFSSSSCMLLEFFLRI